MSQVGFDAASRACEAGHAWPLGASCMTVRGRRGVNFAVASLHAERVELCLFDAQGIETARLTLPQFTNGIWHGFVPGIEAGQLYGLRAHGPYQPERGHRFNPAKLLIDPFARALVGSVDKLSLELDYLPPTGPLGDVLQALPDPSDNAARMPKAQVLDLEAELMAGRAIAPAPRVPLNKTVLYEAHVKGLTQRHPDVPAAWRGRYAGVASAPMLAYYQRLGITTLCLLPVQLALTEAHLFKKGLRNYWGYNTLGYFIPEPSYASGEFADDRAEFRHMVDQLHRQGLEVVLDVVFNHSAESDAFGPTLSWRGLDNASWYTLDSAGQCLNFSGCGNSLDLSQPCAVQWVMDSLRWWVKAFGVDGFRFDLATTLGRSPALKHHFHPLSGLLSAMAQDPVLARVKLIAEPWDLGPDGYKLGHFPAGWQEWNDRFRDTTRAFWLGHSATRGELARRLSGSSDCFDHDGRSPLASVNLITAHDGMTLVDLTSYHHKHNHSNGEDNRDGHNYNLSANAGVEGLTLDVDVLATRGQWQRALMATLFCAQGVPQLLAGDELGHTQRGNNNAYCQDNDTTWLDWSGRDSTFTDFVAGLIHLRQAHAALRHNHWFTGLNVTGKPGAGPDISWCQANGQPMTSADWDDPHARTLACVIQVPDTKKPQSPLLRWCLVFHAGDQAVQCALPAGRWQRVLDSHASHVLQQSDWHTASCFQDTVAVPARAVMGLVQWSDVTLGYKPVETP